MLWTEKEVVKKGRNTPLLRKESKFHPSSGESINHLFFILIHLRFLSGSGQACCLLGSAGMLLIFCLLFFFLNIKFPVWKPAFFPLLTWDLKAATKERRGDLPSGWKGSNKTWQLQMTHDYMLWKMGLFLCSFFKTTTLFNSNVFELERAAITNFAPGGRPR